MVKLVICAKSTVCNEHSTHLTKRILHTVCIREVCIVRHGRGPLEGQHERRAGGDGDGKEKRKSRRRIMREKRKGDEEIGEEMTIME